MRELHGRTLPPLPEASPEDALLTLPRPAAAAATAALAAVVTITTITTTTTISSISSISIISSIIIAVVVVTHAASTPRHISGISPRHISRQPPLREATSVDRVAFLTLLHEAGPQEDIRRRRSIRVPVTRVAVVLALELVVLPRSEVGLKLKEVRFVPQTIRDLGAVGQHWPKLGGVSCGERLERSCRPVVRDAAAQRVRRWWRR